MFRNLPKSFFVGSWHVAGYAGAPPVDPGAGRSPAILVLFTTIVFNEFISLIWLRNCNLDLKS
ncbi:hypothetical protein PanWU01x14_113830 [Parasponia andersonii]|uniref:Uncharacterized protein n=1 Tax=Parasponia andersonii TaxID=3476 RepID=A0A2P5CXX6_PARAD|nr:hypothetical protein PanWU01x14_113830 [Parasponia andersonii]